jgi:hypothetical protein
MPWYRMDRIDRTQRDDTRQQDHRHAEQARPRRLEPCAPDHPDSRGDLVVDVTPRATQRPAIGTEQAGRTGVVLQIPMRAEQTPLRHETMIGTIPRSHQRFPAAIAIACTFAACGGGGGAAANLAPTIVSAAFVGAGGSPVAGEELVLVFSEDISLSGTPLTDADVTLSGNATLGAVPAVPLLIAARAISITLGPGVTFTPGSTQIALSTGNDSVRDSAGLLGTGGAAVTIGTSDGQSPTLSNVTIADIDDALNGNGTAGGTLQVAPNGWTLDLTFADNGAVDVASTQITTTVAVTTSAGTQAAGVNLMPFLSVDQSNATSATIRVPGTVSFPLGPFTLSCVVVDVSGLASTADSIAGTVRAFTNDVRPFETTVNSQQLWFLDFSRDIESFTTSAVAGGISVDVVNGANGRSDFEDILHVIGLQSASPIPNVSGGLSSNDLASAALENAILANLADLFAGANIAFTLTPPGSSFGGSASVVYDALDHSRISIAGAATTNGVLGVAIFDPSNGTQNDDTRTDFSGVRLGVFLHTMADSGMGPPSSSAFRLAFGPLASSLGGTPVGNDAQDGQRLLGSLNDARRNIIDGAIADLGRFLAVVTAHECGHSMGLVQNGAMPVGLYGNDPTNFPGSQDGHIRNAALFPVGSTNVMSPSLSFSAAVNAATGFNSLNLAYLREQVFYGN